MASQPENSSPELQEVEDVASPMGVPIFKCLPPSLVPLRMLSVVPYSETELAYLIEWRHVDTKMVQNWFILSTVFKTIHPNIVLDFYTANIELLDPVQLVSESELAFKAAQALASAGIEYPPSLSSPLSDDTSSGNQDQEEDHHVQQNGFIYNGNHALINGYVQTSSSSSGIGSTGSDKDSGEDDGRPREHIPLFDSTTSEDNDDEEEYSALWSDSDSDSDDDKYELLAMDENEAREL